MFKIYFFYSKFQKISFFVQNSIFVQNLIFVQNFIFVVKNFTFYSKFHFLFMASKLKQIFLYFNTAILFVLNGQKLAASKIRFLGSFLAFCELETEFIAPPEKTLNI